MAGIAGLLAWLWYVRCEKACAAAEHTAQDMFQRGEVVSVLEFIDDMDTRFNCARFTCGDAPPLYALAEACILKLSSDGQSSEKEKVLANARGRMLKELAKRTEKPGSDL